MPAYTFELRDGAKAVTDETGVCLPDRQHALEYAQEIIRELMRGCEAQTRSWRLDIYEGGEGPVLTIPFVQFDPAFADLDPLTRTRLERLCDSHRSLREVVHAARETVRESRALVARARREPYLATFAGERTIRS